MKYKIIMKNIRDWGFPKGSFRKGNVEPFLSIYKAYADILNQPWYDDCCENGSGSILPTGYNSENQTAVFYNPDTKTWNVLPGGGEGGAFIPLAGTNMEEIVTGDIEVISSGFAIKAKNANEDNFNTVFLGDSEVSLINQQDATGFTKISAQQGKILISSNIAEVSGLSGEQDFSPYISDLDYPQEIYVIPRTGTKTGKPVLGDIQIDALTNGERVIYSGNLGSIYKKLYFDDDGSTFGLDTKNSEGFQTRLQLGQSGIKILADAPDAVGLSGEQDFTANITDLDYVQKKYVDGKFIPLTGTETSNPVTGNIRVGVSDRHIYYGDLSADYNSFYFGDDGSYVQMESKVGADRSYFQLNGSAAIMYSEILNSRGIIGSQDFTPNITDLDYVQKKYVDTKIMYGSITFPLDGVQTVFVIPHGMSTIPSSFSLTFSDGTNTEFISSDRSIDSSNITITCDNAPTGTDMTVYWQSFK